MSILIIFLCHIASVDLEQLLGYFYDALLYFCLINLKSLSQHHNCVKKSDQHNSVRYLLLRFTEKNTESHTFWTTWRWVNDARSLIFWWTIEQTNLSWWILKRKYTMSYSKWIWMPDYISLFNWMHSLVKPSVHTAVCWTQYLYAY